MDAIYLDNNATTRPADEVVAAMAEANAKLWANPSSVHRLGQQARQRVELARESVAKLIGAKPGEIVFTSGGTESNNLALRGPIDAARHNAPQTPVPVAVVTSAIEHSAIREPVEALGSSAGGALVERVALADHGVVSPQAVGALLSNAADQLEYADKNERSLILLSLQWANNETGVTQPIADIAAGVNALREAWRQEGRRTRIVFHCDATQAVGKLPVDVTQAGVDLLTLSPHKFHGPKGVGALFARRGIRLLPQQRGGPQERDRRGGTENTTAIIGMGVACELAGTFVENPEHADRLRALRDQFERRILDRCDIASVNGPAGPTARLWNTSNIAFDRLEAEAILIGLSERGVCASAGAACSSGSLEPSPVLLAMGVPETRAHGSVRFSISRETTETELDAAGHAVFAVVGKLSQAMLPA